MLLTFELFLMFSMYIFELSQLRQFNSLGEATIYFSHIYDNSR